MAVKSKRNTPQKSHSCCIKKLKIYGFLLEASSVGEGAVAPYSNCIVTNLFFD